MRKTLINSLNVGASTLVQTHLPHPPIPPPKPEAHGRVICQVRLESSSNGHAAHARTHKRHPCQHCPSPPPRPVHLPTAGSSLPWQMPPHPSSKKQKLHQQRPLRNAHPPLTLPHCWMRRLDPAPHPAAPLAKASHNLPSIPFHWWALSTHASRSSLLRRMRKRRSPGTAYTNPNSAPPVSDAAALPAQEASARIHACGWVGWPECSEGRA